MMQLNPKHDLERRSWVESANTPDSHFPIQNLPFGAFEREGSPGCMPRPIGGSWRALEGMPLITLPKDNPLQRLIEATLVKEEVTPGKRTVVEHMQTAIAMAQAGLGIVVLPSFCEHICQHYRVRINEMIPAIEFSFYRITRAGRDEVPVLNDFSDMFAQAAQRRPDPCE